MASLHDSIRKSEAKNISSLKLHITNGSIYKEEEIIDLSSDNAINTLNLGHTNNKKNSKINRVLNTEHLEGNKQNLICHHAVPGEWRILLYNWTLYSSYHQLYRLIKINHTIIFKIVICRIAWIIKIMICNLTCIMIRMKIILMFNMNYQNDTRIWGESNHSFWKSSNWNSYAPKKDIRT